MFCLVGVVAFVLLPLSPSNSPVGFPEKVHGFGNCSWFVVGNILYFDGVPHPSMPPLEKPFGDPPVCIHAPA